MRWLVDAPFGARGICARLMAAALPGLALLAMAAAAVPASASVDADDWATPLIERSLAEERTAGPRVRRTRGERHASADLDGQREVPHRHGKRREEPQSLTPTPTTPTRGHARQARGARLRASELPRPRAKRQKEPLGTVIASLGREFMRFLPNEPAPLSVGPIRWLASEDCLAAPLRTVLADLALAFGGLRVNSTCRSPRHNARVGGAKHSFHLTGNAADFRLPGNARTILAFLRARNDVGGLKHYGHGVFHIDTGPRRTW